jgi:hypothetical protein
MATELSAVRLPPPSVRRLSAFAAFPQTLLLEPRTPATMLEWHGLRTLAGM